MRHGTSKVKSTDDGITSSEILKEDKAASILAI